VGVHAVEKVHPGHLRAVLGVVEDLLGRDVTGAEDLLIVVNVVQEPVERGHALHQTLLHDPPLVVRN